MLGKRQESNDIFPQGMAKTSKLRNNYEELFLSSIEAKGSGTLTIAKSL